MVWHQIAMSNHHACHGDRRRGGRSVAWVRKRQGEEDGEKKTKTLNVKKETERKQEEEGAWTVEG